MTIAEITAAIKKIGWDSKHTSAGDEAFIKALNIPALGYGEFATAEERANGITVRKTGSGKFVATQLSSGYKTEPLDTQKAAIGRLRANTKTAEALKTPLHK